MNRITTIELHKENMKFSSGHFTMFSAEKREPLHGHNFTVAAEIDTLVGDEGLSFDYRFYKRKILEICKRLNHSFLIPEKSKYLDFTEDENYFYVHFKDEKIPFIRSDITLLPLYNISVEDLSAWFVEQMIADKALLDEHKIQRVLIKVFSAPGQSSSYTWER